MAASSKQTEMIRKMKSFAKKFSELYAEAQNVKQSWEELYASTQDYSVDPDNTSTAILAADLFNEGVNYIDLNAFSNQPVTKYIDFYEGVAVSARDYGKDVRTIEDVN